MTEDRLHILEQRMEHLGGTVLRVDQKLDDIAEALRSLVRIEERQVSTNERLSNGVKTFQDHEERLRELELKVPPKLDERLGYIERKLPSLIESRKWMIMGMLGLIGIIGVAVLKLVFVK